MNILKKKLSKKYNQDKDDYTGAISMPIFEVLVSGVSLAIELKITDMPAKKLKSSKNLEPN